MTEKRYYSAHQVADMFDVDQKTVGRWARRGRVASIRTPGGKYRFPADEIDALFESTMRGELPEIAALERAIRGYYSSRPTQALLDLAFLLGVDIAYIDSDRFAEHLKRHHDRDLTTDEWKRIAEHLGELGNVVDELCDDVLSAYMDSVLNMAEVIPEARKLTRRKSDA